MANGKIVKYKKVYKIIVEGKTDTKLPEDEPWGLIEADMTIKTMVAFLNDKYKWRNISMKELKR